MWRLLIFSTIGAFAVAAAGAQPNDRPPVIDMHVHSTTTSPDALSQLESLNIRYIFLAGLTADLRAWAAAVDGKRYLPALVFPCDVGRAPITGRPCFETATDFPESHGCATSYEPVE
jgi:hypothetical protein